MKSNSIFIKPEHQRKLDWILRAIDEHPSHQEIVGGLLEVRFASAFKNLNQNGVISRNVYH